MRIEGRSYDHGQGVALDVEDGRISNIDTLRCGEKSGLPWLAPGLIDMQVNGFGGQEFTKSDLNVDMVEQISLAMDQLGVTQYLPTVITQGHDLLLHALGTIAAAIELREPVASRVAGIHLEGPYISRVDGPRGAHPKQHCRPPDWEEFQRLQDAARGHIRLVTLSPEYPEAVPFTRRAVQQGVLISIGHTNADAQQIRQVVAAGASMSTHLGNGAHAMIPRHPNYIWEQMSADQLTASLIVDGFHLPPAVVKALVRAKTPHRIVLISDLTGMAGIVRRQPGVYQQTGLGAVEVLEDGRVVVAGQRDYLAGATQPLTVGISNLIRFAGVDLAAAVDMASARPAALLGLPGGALTLHAPADLLQFDFAEDQSIQLLATYRAGHCVWKKEEDD